MIIYKDESKGNISAAVNAENAAVLDIAAFTLGNTRITAQSVDLTDFQGGAFRLYAEENGDLSTDANCDHFWLLVEAVVPEKRLETVTTGEVDDEGREITKMVEVPLDLNNLDIIVYALPEVAK